MTTSDTRNNSGSGLAPTIFGAALTIGAIVLSNKETRNKLLKMVSRGIDRITEGGTGMKDSINSTAERVERNTRKTLGKVKDSVDNMVDETTKGARKATS